MSKKEEKKISLVAFILVLIIMALVCTLLIYLIITGKITTKKIEPVIEDTSSSQTEEQVKNKVVGTKLCDFDLNFLKEENKNENIIYSPLSIKACLKMLEEGAQGESKEQIAKYIGEYTPTKYISNSNMSFANALFVRDKFEVKDTYKKTLESKYNAEVITDSFSSPKVVNSWVAKKTLNLINDLVDDISGYNILLVNALGIDMDWKDKFYVWEDGGTEDHSYEHENCSWHVPMSVTAQKFNNKTDVSGMEIAATINNYDIVNELGEDNIRNTVGNEFVKWAKGLNNNDYEVEYMFNNDMSDSNIQKVKEEYLDNYIKEIDDNYHDLSYSSDFSVYSDNNVKVFAKDLKTYGETTLQYVGIMPIKEELNKYIKNVDEKDINNIISNLKDLKTKNFKEGVVTKITGFIPKFDFEYELNLLTDLEKLGIKDVFEPGKANLKNICDDNLYIDKAVHKANIEFTQDGIKASAATLVGGKGAGESFNYYYDVPIEEIDLTFNKPYMFIIRDKQTGEVWFTGSVYEPLTWENEPENQIDPYGRS